MAITALLDLRVKPEVLDRAVGRRRSATRLTGPGGPEMARPT